MLGGNVSVIVVVMVELSVVEAVHVGEADTEENGEDV